MQIDILIEIGPFRFLPGPFWPKWSIMVIIVTVVFTLFCVIFDVKTAKIETDLSRMITVLWPTNFLVNFYKSTDAAPSGVFGHHTW